MRILLLKPKALYIVTRFAEACGRVGVDLTILFASKPPIGHYAVSFRDGSLDTVETIPVDADAAGALAPFLDSYDAVVAAGEYSVILGERLSARLGLFHNPLERIDAYRDKHLMRECFSEQGVRQPKLLARFANMAEVDAFDWSAPRFPVIAKPIDLSSSFHVRLCHDSGEARQVYRRIFKHSQSFAGTAFTANGLLEEFAPGPEYSAECVVEDATLVQLFLTTKFVSPFPACDEIGHLSGEAFLDAAMERGVRDAVRRIVAAWNVVSAVLHVEFKYHAGEVSIIEAACRIGGDMISTLVDLRYAVSLEECLVRLRCRLPVRDALRRLDQAGGGWCYAIEYLFAENVATRPPEAVEVLESNLHAKPVPAAGGGFGVESRLGHRLLRSRSIDALKDHLSSLSQGRP